MKIKYVTSKDPRSKNFNNLIKEKFSQLLTEKNPDIVLVSGGDGAILHAIQQFNDKNVSFLGRAAGNLNFLMNNFQTNEETIGLLVAGKLHMNELETNGIKVQIKKEGGKVIEVGNAVNEVVIGSTVMGYHSFVINTKDSSFEDFNLQGSGICVSTDLGSTGYNFNLGGSIIPLGSGFWSFMGVVANRYINDLLKSQPIKIKCLCNKDIPHIFIDGIMKEHKLSFNDELVLSEGNNIKINFLEDSDFTSKRTEITSRYRKG